MTLSLAMGVQRMARRNALIKKLSKVEALGSANVICTDKTLYQVLMGGGSGLHPYSK